MEQTGSKIRLGTLQELKNMYFLNLTEKSKFISAV